MPLTWSVSGLAAAFGAKKTVAGQALENLPTLRVQLSLAPVPSSVQMAKKASEVVPASPFANGTVGFLPVLAPARTPQVTPLPPCGIIQAPNPLEFRPDITICPVDDPAGRER